MTPSQTDDKQRTQRARQSHGFALYAVGISVWMTLVSCCGTTYMLPLIPNGVEEGFYVISQQVAYVLTFFVAAILEMRMGPLSHTTAMRLQIGSFAVMIACSIAVFVGVSAAPLLVVYGISLGVGISTGYLQWIHLLIARPEHETIPMLFISSLASVVSGTVFCFIGTGARLVAVIVLAVASLVLLHANQVALREELDQLCATEKRADMREVVRELWVPGICAIVLVLVAPIVSTTYVDAAEQEFFRTTLAQAANLVALGILAVVLLVKRRRLSMTQAYCVMLPVLATAVLASAFFESEHRWFVLFIGDMCFCVVSLLLVITSCDISRRYNVSTTVTYGLFAGAVYLARFPESLLVVAPMTPFTSPAPFAIAVLLLYLLTIPAMVLLYTRNKTAAAERQIAEPHEMSVEEACAVLAQRSSMSARHAEVMLHLAKGDSTQRIAENLHLSESTVRTYRKAVYAALDVHSRQELLDVVHATMHEHQA